jgi:hypothetical protein
MKKFNGIKGTINNIIRKTLFDRYANFSYAQEGEDRILNCLFDEFDKEKGFFVDVGAHHPRRFSNTYLFYLRGWRGINVDANADAISLFQKERPRDINIVMGVGEIAGRMIYFMFNEPALNTFDAKVAQRLVKLEKIKIIEEKIVEIMPLGQILNLYLPVGQGIDFLSVDVEGSDVAVLRSNDWLKYRPSYIAVEYHSVYQQSEGAYFEEILESELNQFLDSKDYAPFAKTPRTIFFALKNR